MYIINSDEPAVFFCTAYFRTWRFHFKLPLEYILYVQTHRREQINKYPVTMFVTFIAGLALLIVARL